MLKLCCVGLEYLKVQELQQPLVQMLHETGLLLTLCFITESVTPYSCWNDPPKKKKWFKLQNLSDKAKKTHNKLETFKEISFETVLIRKHGGTVNELHTTTCSSSSLIWNSLMKVVGTNVPHEIQTVNNLMNAPVHDLLWMSCST